MGLVIMLIGLALFAGVHGVTTQRKLRSDLISRFGEAPYKGVYSLASLAGILLMGYGFGLYRASGYIPLWSPPVWMSHLALLLNWPAIIMIAAAYSPGEIKRRLKHPMLAGVKLWAAAHLLANGDLGSILLFGGILAWAVFDRISLKSRSDPGAPPIPIGGWKNDLVAVIAGTILYLALVFVFHPLVIGVPAFGVK